MATNPAFEPDDAEIGREIGSNSDDNVEDISGGKLDDVGDSNSPPEPSPRAHDGIAVAANDDQNTGQDLKADCPVIDEQPGFDTKDAGDGKGDGHDVCKDERGTGQDTDQGDMGGTYAEDPTSDENKVQSSPEEADVTSTVPHEPIVSDGETKTKDAACQIETGPSDEPKMEDKEDKKDQCPTNGHHEGQIAANNNTDRKNDNDKVIKDDKPDLVRLKRQIGLFSGVTIILGNIIGSGIFITPTSVYVHAGSFGMSMVVWITSGLFSLIGALCFAELGVTIDSSGAEYTYIKKAFGNICAFVVLWVNLIIIIPTGHMIVALTFAYYLVDPFFPDRDCPPPDLFVRIVACLVQALLTFINCWSVPWATKVQDVFTVAKVLALIIIIASGLIWIFMGHTENFENAFEGSASGESIALAFYGGLFAYAAWNYLNYLTEEIKNPQRNLPWAIGISVPLVTLIYVLTNVAYFAVLTPEELMASNAVAVTYGEKLFGPMAWIMPVSVALSTFGGVNGGCLSLSRLFFVGAREGQLPEVMAMIQVKRKTPLPSLIFTCILTVLYVFVKRIETLLNYFSFMTWLAIGAAVAGQIYLRITKPDLPRPIKFPLILPIIFVLACLFLVVMGTIAAPMDTLIGVAITMTGFPVYFIGVYWQNKPKWLNNAIQKFTVFSQKMFFIVSQEKED